MNKLIITIVTTCCFINLLHAQHQTLPIKKWNSFFNEIMKDSGYSNSDVKLVNEEIAKVFSMENQQKYLEAAEYGAAIHKELNSNAFLTALTFTELYAYFLNHISNDYNKIGAYPQALYYGLEAEKCWDNLYKRKKDKYIKLMYVEAVNNLAVFYCSANDIVESEKWIDKELNLTKGVSEYESFYYEMFNIRACLLEKSGRNEEALEIEDAVVTQSTNIKKTWRTNLTRFQYNCGQVDKAISGISQLINEYKLEGLIETVEYANLLNRHATYYENIDINKSISLTQEAIDILKRNNKTLNSDYAQYLSNLAYYYFKKGYKGEAVTMEEKAQKIWSRIQDANNSPSRLLSLRKLAIFQYYNSQEKEAEKNLIEATHVFNDNIRYTMLHTIDTRQAVWNGCQKWYLNTIPLFAANIQSDSLCEVAYDAALLSKGILLNTEQTLQAMADEGGQQIRALYDEWQYARQKLETPHPLEETSRLKDESEEKERLFVSKCRSLKDVTARLSITWKDVQGRLENGDVAIEFCSYKQGNRFKYVALIIKKNMCSPKIVPLFYENQLSATKKSIYTVQNGSILIWQPLAYYLQDIRNIYFSPCGELNNIAIESLPHWSENCLMSDKWNLYRLSSTRELVIAKNNNSFKKAVVYGGINYDTSIDMLFNDNKFESNNQVLISRNLDSLFPNKLKEINQRALSSRGITNQYTYANPTQHKDFSGQRGGYGKLEGTKKEAEEVCKLLEQTNIKTTLYEDSKATEGSVKKLSGKKVNLLHIGTHGFYFPESEVHYWTHLDFLHRFDNESQYIEDKALTRSGLLFSGANSTWEGKKAPIGIDDGILTAQEISHLDLRELDLVVLAACETGLGEIKGDGVFGLQRGFKKAGANSLLMTLWKVDDEATSLLMSHFYKNLLSGKSKSESLRQAQSIIQKKYQDPKFWAGFILLDAIN